MARTVSHRFEACVAKNAVTGCWEWTGFINQRGYGKIRGFGSKKMRAHRLSWELFKGPIPAGFLVLHRCDVTHCVNPEHLFLGTQEDNLCDMATKGRAAKSVGPKLNAVQVREIRRLVAAGKTQRSVGVKFGVSEATVWNIIHRRTWNNLY